MLPPWYSFGELLTLVSISSSFGLNLTMSDYFSSDVIQKILHKLPLKSLVRCISVCKAWKSIITDHAFIISHHHQHLQTDPSNSSLFFHIQSLDDDYDELEGNFYSLYSDDDATDYLLNFKLPPPWSSHSCDSWFVVGTCNGLVCFNDYESETVNIWNPSIHKYLTLPKPSHTFETDEWDVSYGFGFDSLNHDFRVVRIVPFDFPEISSQVEIYSLATHSWRSITVAPLPFGIFEYGSKFVNGVLHWLAYQTINGMKRYFILTFEVYEEKFGELMFPQCLQSVDVSGGLSILTGGNLLALEFSNSDEGYSIWVMKKYGVVESWTKLFRFDFNGSSYTQAVSAVRNNEKVVIECMKAVMALRNNEEVIIEGFFGDITFLDPIKGLVKKISHNFCMGFVPFVGDHVESLFLINEKYAETYLPL